MSKVASNGVRDIVGIVEGSHVIVAGYEMQAGVLRQVFPPPSPAPGPAPTPPPAPPPPPPPLSLVVSGSGNDTNDPVYASGPVRFNWTVAVTGGVAPYTYRWVTTRTSISLIAESSNSGATYPRSHGGGPQVGSWSADAQVTVTDATGSTSSASATSVYDRS